MHTQQNDHGYMENQSVTWNYMVDVLGGAVSSAKESSPHVVNNDASCIYTEVFFLPNNFIKSYKRYAAKSNSEGSENTEI